ncbi:hypothetical protein FPQ18DRAFT_113737 [Pyronema domesticum]|nr:hypothetical protein FPQ18DRAFT_113737 [Pyronema domesticum]
MHLTVILFCLSALSPKMALHRQPRCFSLLWAEHTVQVSSSSSLKSHSGSRILLTIREDLVCSFGFTPFLQTFYR